MTYSFPIEEISYFDNAIFNFKLNVITPKLSSLHKLISPLKINFKTGIIIWLQNSINKDLTKLLIMIEGLNAHISKPELFDFDKTDYDKFSALFLKFRNSYERFDKVNFFDNPRTRIVADAIILELFEIDYKLKDILYTESHLVNSDGEMIKIASEISLHTALELID